MVEEKESPKDQKTQKKKRKGKSNKKKVDDEAKPSTSGLSTPASSSTSKTTSTTEATGANGGSKMTDSVEGASTVKVSPVKEKANGKQFIKERPKLPPSTLKRSRINSSSSDESEDDDKLEDHETILEDHVLPFVPFVPFDSPEVPVKAVEAVPRYPKREGQPRVNYSEAEVPDDDHYLCKLMKIVVLQSFFLYC